jgi:hypothetical protein
MLARPPARWSLRHYVKNARDAEPRTQDKQQQAVEFAAIKQELLAAREAMKQLTLGNA